MHALYCMQGPVVFNSNGSRDARVIRVEQYHVAGKKGSSTTIEQYLIFIESGSVERPTMAEVVINPNSSELIFKDNLRVTSLWTSKQGIITQGSNHLGGGTEEVPQTA